MSQLPAASPSCTPWTGTAPTGQATHPMPMPPPHHPTTPPQPTPAGLRAAHRTRAATLTALLALVVLCVGWELWWAPLVPGGSWLLAGKALPLLTALPGVLRMRMYTYRWLCLLVWLYLTEGAVRAFSDPAPSRWLALAEVALALAVFASATLHIRLRLKHAKAALAQQPTA